MADEFPIVIRVDPSDAETGKREVNRQLGEIERRGEQSTEKLRRGFKGVSGAVDKLKVALGGLTAGLVLRDTIRTIQEFQGALIGVGKTADLTGDQLDDLADSTLALRNELRAVTTSTLLELQQVAGQLGVKGADNILRFSAVLAQLESATDVVGSEGATQVARLLEITGDGIGVVERFGSVLVALGNSMAATEREILTVGAQVAQNTAIFGAGSEEAAALGAAYASIGVRAELAGSATGRAFRAIDTAIREQGQALRDLSTITGVTAEEITETFGEDAVGAFQLFLEGLGRIRQEVGAGGVVDALAALGLQGEELLRVLPTAAERAEVFGRALRLAGEEFEDATALSDEFSRVQNTLGTAFLNLRETIKEVQLELRGTSGALTEIVDTGSEAIRIIGGVEGAFEDASGPGRVLAASLEGVGTVLGGLAAFRGVRFLGGLLGIANPVGATVAALGALSVALLNIRQRAVDATREGLEPFSRELSDVSQQIDAISRARVSLQDAIETGDVAAQIRSVQAELESLQDLEIRLMQGEQPSIEEFLEALDRPANPQSVDRISRRLIRQLLESFDRQRQAFGETELDIGDLVRFILPAGDSLFEPRGDVPRPIEQFINPDTFRGDFENQKRRLTTVLEAFFRDAQNAVDIDPEVITEFFRQVRAGGDAALGPLRQRIQDFVSLQEALENQLADTTPGLADFTEGGEVLTRSLGDLLIAIEAEQAALFDSERALLQAENAERALTAAVEDGVATEAEAQRVREGGITQNEKLAEALEAVRVQTDASFARRKAGELDEFAEGLREEAELARLSALGLEGEATALALRNDLLRSGLSAQEADLLLTAERVAEIENLAAQGERLAQSVKFGSQASSALVDPFRQALLSEDLDDLGRDIGTRLIASIADTLVFDPLEEALRSFLTGIRLNFGGGLGSIFPSATGNVFRDGRVIPFQRGGILGGPALFPLGLAGEKGPEAIVPLNPDLTAPIAGGGKTELTRDGGVLKIAPFATPAAVGAGATGASPTVSTAALQSELDLLAGRLATFGSQLETAERDREEGARLSRRQRQEADVFARADLGSFRL